MITELVINKTQLRRVQSAIKLECGYDYLTKKRCRREYGFDWSTNGQIKLRFYTELSQSMYYLKWS